MPEAPDRNAPRTRSGGDYTGGAEARMDRVAQAFDATARRYRREHARQRAVAIAVVAAVVVVSMAATALVMFPAQWIAPLFARATAGRVLLVDTRGTLWNGSANIMLAPGGSDGDGSDGSDGSGVTAGGNGIGGGVGSTTLLPNRVAWRAGLSGVFQGRLQLTMREEKALAQDVVIDVRRSGTTVYAGGIDLPANVLNGLGAPFNTLDFQGAIRLEWTDWRLVDTRAYGQFAVTLRNAASSISRVRPLGSYRATIVAGGQQAEINLATLAGPLSLTGNGVAQAGHFSFNGQAQATPETRQNLSGLLNILGRRIDDRTSALSIMR